MSRTASTPSRKRIVNEKPNASAGAARPLAASSRSTSSRCPRRATVLVADVGHGRAVADPAAQLGEGELGVEDEVGVAQPQRDLDALEVVEVGVAGQAVGARPVTRLDGVERGGDLGARQGHLAAALGELVAAVRRGHTGQRRGEDERQDDAAPREGHRSMASAFVEVRDDLLDGRGDLRGGGLRPHRRAQLRADGLLQALLELGVLGLERALDLLEVRDVGLRDLLFGRRVVALAVGGERCAQGVARLGELAHRGRGRRRAGGRARPAVGGRVVPATGDERPGRGHEDDGADQGAHVRAP